MAVNAGQRRNQYSRKPKRKKPEFLRSRNENRLGMTVTVLALVIIMAVVGFHSISLRQKEAQYAAREQELLQLMEQEEKRTEELKQFETYTKTKKYAEEVARDKLGFVYDNEIIFKGTE
ncbi:MAG: septum formation initiator family protein [Lachnospiraceae bacterium]|jgi:cell division protein DivIC|nr:septum formation initiator family protein [Lachnospiraceae bacterium]